MHKTQCYIIALLWTLVFSLPARAQVASPDELLKQALHHTRVTRDYDEAIRLARRGVQISPDYPDLRLILGRLCLMTGKLDEGEAQLTYVLKKDPGNKQAFNYLVNTFAEHKEYGKAISFASQYLKMYPEDHDMLFKRISFYIEGQQYTDASRELERMRADSRAGEPFIYYSSLLGSRYRANEQPDDAARMYRLGLQADPGNKDILQALFNIHAESGHIDEALIYAERLHRADPGSGIRMKQADLLAGAGRLEEASELSARLFAAQPADSAVAFLHNGILLQKARFHIDQGDTLRARIALDGSLSAMPADTIARNTLIALLTSAGNYQEALAVVNSGLSYHPDNTSLQVKKIDLLRAAGRLEEAYSLSDSLAGSTDGIRTIRDELFLLTRKNRAGITYSLTGFDEPGREPWNLYSVFYMREGRYGAIAGRVNYADRNNARGTQFEVEAYPKHFNSYSYINLAYSNALVFPKFRFSYSYYMPVTGGWEAEAGFRYLHSYYDYLSYTGAVSKYTGRLWINFRAFATPNGGRVADSYTLSGRYYPGDSREDYITGIVAYGFSPDDRGRNFEFKERLNLESLRFTAGYQRTFLKRAVAGIFATWNNQEYISGRRRGEFDLTLSLYYKF